MSYNGTTIDLENGWKWSTSTYEADVIINPPRWAFWRKPRTERQTFTSSVFHREPGEDETLSVSYPQLLTWPDGPALAPDAD